MKLEELKSSGNIIYEVVSGSHAYGTALPTSDTDLRGYYYVDPNEYVSLNPPVKDNECQINDDKHDIVYYSLYRAFNLLKKSNPNQIELLWIPEDCVRTKHPMMDIMLANRQKFVSKKAYYSHAEYAKAQIKKARGANKRVHNPQPKERPTKDQFCWVIEKFQGYAKIENQHISGDHGVLTVNIEESRFPSRPVPLNSTDIDLVDYHVASLEHVENTYRLYNNGKDSFGVTSRGVFRNEMLVTESISIEEEFDKFAGLLIYNEVAYNKAVKEWKQYWEWMKNRNEARWIDQEAGNLDYDQKNMAHCIRLMLSSKNILENGEPIVRLQGADLDFVMSIRNGEKTYDEIMERANELDDDLAILFKKSDLPEDVNHDELEHLYRDILYAT
tara:strand:- start:1517 stop:2677 length:1161 start_codon:yes stop_codon:yes gene_type:complete